MVNLLWLLLPNFHDWKNPYMQGFTEDVPRNSIKEYFYQSVNESIVCLKEFTC